MSKENIMFTHLYNGMYINGSVSSPVCTVADDYNTFSGKQFKSYRAAQVAITKARNSGIPASK